MYSFVRFVFLFFSALASTNAFTVVKPSTTLLKTRSANLLPTNVLTPMKPKPTSTSLPMFVDWGVVYPDESAIGSIAMLIALVSFWEITTPGRAKKV
jgi:hypothetical protein